MVLILECKITLKGSSATFYSSQSKSGKEIVYFKVSFPGTQSRPEYLNYEVAMIFQQDLIVHVSLNFNEHQSTPEDPEV